MRFTRLLTYCIAALPLSPLAGPLAGQAEVVKDLVAGANGSAGDDLITYKGKVYFEASIAGVGAELFVADGPTSAKLFKDLRTGNDSSAPGEFCEFGGKLYFAATLPSVGRELLVSDGTSGGTKLLTDVWSGGSSSPSKLTVAGTKMFFFARTSSLTLGVFVTDGSAAGTKLLKNFGGQGVSDMGRIGTTTSVFFSADSSAGVELWISDGTVLGTKLFKDLKAGSGHSWPAQFVQIGTKTFFTATTTPGKRELWSSDGSLLGTTMVGSSVNVTSPLVVLKSEVYFEGADGNTDREIWKSDGTKAGTKRVVDVRPGLIGSNPDWLTPVAGKWIYFSAQVFDGRGREVWRTDGTAAGTLQVAEIYPGSNSSNPRGSSSRFRYAVNGDYVYFYAYNLTVGSELFSLKTSAATSYKEGVGCGNKPTLATAFPVLGKVMTISGTRASATTGILAYGIPALIPVNLGSCVLRVDFSQPVILTGITTPTATWNVGLGIPNFPSLSGLIIELQAAFGTSSGIGIDLTNSVRLLSGT